jgi:hypothetical protein
MTMPTNAARSATGTKISSSVLITLSNTALTAFQRVEDNLAALRVLENEARQQHEATASAEQSTTSQHVMTPQASSSNSLPRALTDGRSGRVHLAGRAHNQLTIQ